MMMTVRRIIVGACAVVALGILLEHIAVVNEERYWAPSTLLEWARAQADWAWEAFGSLCAFLSGWLHWICVHLRDWFIRILKSLHLEMLGASVVRFCTPFIGLLFSWLKWFAGWSAYVAAATGSSFHWMYTVGGVGTAAALSSLLLYTSRGRRYVGASVQRLKHTASACVARFQ